MVNLITMYPNNKIEIFDIRITSIGNRDIICIYYNNIRINNNIFSNFIYYYPLLCLIQLYRSNQSKVVPIDEEDNCKYSIGISISFDNLMINNNLKYIAIYSTGMDKSVVIDEYNKIMKYISRNIYKIEG
jgi:hypothetical protein